MDIAEFTGAPPTPQEGEEPSTEVGSAVEGSGVIDRPEPIRKDGSPDPSFTTSITPSGIEILYQWEPKRLYRVRQAPPLDNILGEPAWLEVPSVTTVLDCLSKDGLPWWGMKVGARGTAELIARGFLEPRMLSVDRLDANAEYIAMLLTQHKLTVNHVRDTAGDRGKSVHDTLELWAGRTDYRPDPEGFPATERPYQLGLTRFLEAVGDKLRPVHSELMVASAEYGYAGRFDLLAELIEPVELVINARTGQTRVFEPGLGLWDLKTSSGVYPTHFMQLAAYKKACAECGYGLPDFEAVIHVDKESLYEVVLSNANINDFLNIKIAGNSVERLKGWKTRQKREAA